MLSYSIVGIGKEYNGRGSQLLFLRSRQPWMYVVQCFIRNLLLDVALYFNVSEYCQINNNVVVGVSSIPSLSILEEVKVVERERDYKESKKQMAKIMENMELIRNEVRILGKAVRTMRRNSLKMVYSRRKIYRITNYCLQDISTMEDHSECNTSYYSLDESSFVRSDGCATPLKGLNLNINYIK